MLLKSIVGFDGIFEDVKLIGKEMKVRAKNDGLAFFSLENPKERLRKSTKKKIFDNFYQVALSAFNREDTDFFRDDVYEHLFSGYFLTLVFDSRKNNLGVAFMSSNFMEYDGLKVFYIEGTAVASEYHNLGIYQGIVREMSPSVDFVACRTQNPAAFAGLSKNFKAVYLVNANPNKKVKDIAGKIAQYLNMEDYEYSRMKGCKTYGQSLVGNALEISNDAEKQFLEKINREAGDCLILVCSV